MLSQTLQAEELLDVVTKQECYVSGKLVLAATAPEVAVDPSVEDGLLRGATRNLIMTSFGYEEHPDDVRALFGEGCVHFELKEGNVRIEMSSVAAAMSSLKALSGKFIGGAGPIILKYTEDKVQYYLVAE